jgi:hypothetical protein
MLNEVEIVYWSITNKTVQISAIESSLILDYLMITALFSKKLTCEASEIKVHESFLSHNYPMFMANYEVWFNIQQIKSDNYKL